MIISYGMTVSEKHDRYIIKLATMRPTQLGTRLEPSMPPRQLVGRLHPIGYPLHLHIMIYFTMSLQCLRKLLSSL